MRSAIRRTAHSKDFHEVFETGLRDDVLVANLRPILRTSGLTDEELMKHVNELASHQAERQNKTGERRLAKVNACKVDETEIKQHRRVNVDNDNRILEEIREIRSELENLKHQQVGGNNEQSTTHYDRKQPKSTRYRGWGCQACKERRTGASCQHCFACGEFGHIASECAKNTKVQGTRSGYPAVGTGFNRRCNIPSV